MNTIDETHQVGWIDSVKCQNKLNAQEGGIVADRVKNIKNLQGHRYFEENRLSSITLPLKSSMLHISLVSFVWLRFNEICTFPLVLHFSNRFDHSALSRRGLLALALSHRCYFGATIYSIQWSHPAVDLTFPYYRDRGTLLTAVLESERSHVRGCILCNFTCSLTRHINFIHRKCFFSISSS